MDPPSTSRGCEYFRQRNVDSAPSLVYNRGIYDVARCCVLFRISGWRAGYYRENDFRGRASFRLRDLRVIEMFLQSACVCRCGEWEWVIWYTRGWSVNFFFFRRLVWNCNESEFWRLVHFSSIFLLDVQWLKIRVFCLEFRKKKNREVQWKRCKRK